jgi:hypothetical protein
VVAWTDQLGFIYVCFLWTRTPITHWSAHESKLSKDYMLLWTVR